MLSEFPRLAGEKCVTLLLTQENSDEVVVSSSPHSQKTVHLFTAFAAFLPSPDRNGIIDHLLSIATEQLSSLLSEGTLDGVIETLRQMHNLLRSLATWVNSSQVPADAALRSLVSSWLRDRFATLAQSSATAVAAIPSIATLAAAKRQMAQFSAQTSGRFVLVRRRCVMGDAGACAGRGVGSFTAAGAGVVAVPRADASGDACGVCESGDARGGNLAGVGQRGGFGGC